MTYRRLITRIVLGLLLIIVIVGLGCLGCSLYTQYKTQKNFDAATLTAFGTWVLIVGTLIAVYLQLGQQRQINSANTVLMLHDHFESAIMHNYRKQLAERLLKDEFLMREDAGVLVFFETMGLLTHKGVLDKEMVWNEFSWEVIRYYLALTKESKNQIEKLREKARDSTLYSEFEWLNKELIKIDCGHRGVKEKKCEAVLPSPTQIEHFLKEESRLS